MNWNQQGKNNPFYGRHHTRKWKQNHRKLIKLNAKTNPNFGMRGKHHTEETKEKIRRKAIERFKDKRNHPMYDKKHTKKAKNKMSKNNGRYWLGKHFDEKTSDYSPRLKSGGSGVVHCVPFVAKAVFRRTVAEHYGFHSTSDEHSSRVHIHLRVPSVDDPKGRNSVVEHIIQQPVPSLENLVSDIWIEDLNAYRHSSQISKIGLSVSRFCKRMSIAQKGKKFSEETKRKMRKPKSETHRKNISKTRTEQWKDSEFQKRMYEAFNRKPNESEKLLIKLIKKYDLPFVYIGDLRPEGWVGGKNPDFISTDGSMRIIEHFGEYWHTLKTKMTPEQRIEHFASNGYDTLIIWESELGNFKDIIEQIQEFGRI